MFNGIIKKTNVLTIIFIVLLVIIALIMRFTKDEKVNGDENSRTSDTASTTLNTDQNSGSNNSLNNQKPMKENQKVTIETNKGNIVVELYTADAPKTAENFVTLANKGFYNGVIFHRIISGFMIQGGDPTGTGRGGPGYTFADELNPATASYKAGYKRGVLAMANAGPNTNGSQFFIMHKDYPLPNNYTIFGHVIEGLDVVDAIASVPTQAERPLSDVTMKSVKTE